MGTVIGAPDAGLERFERQYRIQSTERKRILLALGGKATGDDQIRRAAKRHPTKIDAYA